MIRISSRVLVDAAPFTMFFFFWVLLFGLFFIILGNTYGEDDDHPEDANDYARLPWSVGMLIYSWRNALGDLEPPNGAIWDNPATFDSNSFNKSQIFEYVDNDKYDGVLRRPGAMTWEQFDKWAKD